MKRNYRRIIIFFLFGFVCAGGYYYARPKVLAVPYHLNADISFSFSGAIEGGKFFNDYQIRSVGLSGNFDGFTSPSQTEGQRKLLSNAVFSPISGSTIPVTIKGTGDMFMEDKLLVNPVFVQGESTDADTQQQLGVISAMINNLVSEKFVEISKTPKVFIVSPGYVADTISLTPEGKRIAEKYGVTDFAIIVGYTPQLRINGQKISFHNGGKITIKDTVLEISESKITVLYKGATVITGSYRWETHHLMVSLHALTATSTIDIKINDISPRSHSFSPPSYTTLSRILP